MYRLNEKFIFYESVKRITEIIIVFFHNDRVWQPVTNSNNKSNDNLLINWNFNRNRKETAVGVVGIMKYKRNCITAVRIKFK